VKEWDISNLTKKLHWKWTSYIWDSRRIEVFFLSERLIRYENGDKRPWLFYDIWRVISLLYLIFFVRILYHSIALIEGYLLIRDFCFANESRSIWTRSSFRVLKISKISTRIFSLPFDQLVLCLVWLDSPNSGLSNDDRVEFVFLGLRGRQGGEGTRFGLL
jgi:hypothetical protein